MLKIKILVALGILLLLIACNQKVVKEIALERLKNFAINMGLMDPPPKPPEPDSYIEPSLDQRHVNGEFVRELYRVVLNREVKDESEFTAALNVLDQGGHFEGLYNGLVYSDEYRKMETGTAPVAAFKEYAELMAWLTLDQKYDSIRKMSEEKPSGAENLPGMKTESAMPKSEDLEKEHAAMVERFSSSSLLQPQYSLKRKLGEELLRTIDLKKEYREKLATWYGTFTARINVKGVDYGLPQRNKSEGHYHYRWALQNTEDRIKWECLNRLHRLMNDRAK
jgi:hypothetical protein